MGDGRNGERLHQTVDHARCGGQDMGCRRQADRTRIHLLQPCGEVSRRGNARAVDFGRNRDEFRHHRPLAVVLGPGRLRNCGKCRRQRQLHGWRNRPCIGHRLARSHNAAARQGSLRDRRAVVQRIGMGPPGLPVDERRNQDGRQPRILLSGRPLPRTRRHEPPLADGLSRLPVKPLRRKQPRPL